MTAELFISGNDGKVYCPSVLEGIEWSTERKGTPGKLTFKVLGDRSFEFSEGRSVQLRIDGKNVFFGFVFGKKADKDGIISVTAYDQLRYLKNKDTYVYGNKTAAELLKMLADDFRLKTGEIEDTKYVIPSRVEENTSLFDIMGNALDLTLENTGEMFVLFDDFGRLSLKNISSMYVKEGDKYFCIDEESSENFECASDIDKDVYNKVKLYRDNGKKGGREFFVEEDSENGGKWGVLQYFGRVSKDENGREKAKQLLKLYNVKNRSLKIKKALGDTRVRAGCSVFIRLNAGETQINGFMLVERAVHKFKNDEHFMDLTLRGGEFNG